IPKRGKPGRDEAINERVEIFEEHGAGEGDAPPHNTTPVRPLGSMFNFAVRMLEASRNWKDTLQSRLPGGAERIVYIRLTENEGGQNLNMPTDRIENMIDMGHAAGQQLVEAFERDNGARFDQHRYIRAVSLMKEMDEAIARMKRAYRPDEKDKAPVAEGLKPYPDLIRDYDGGYANSPEWREKLNAYIDALIAARDAAKDLTFDNGKTPEQFAALRVSAEAQIFEFPTEREAGDALARGGGDASA
ncbi:MAG: hypothetical protein AAFU55_11005, partial [Pseudomonadota bacterium]